MCSLCNQLPTFNPECIFTGEHQASAAGRADATGSLDEAARFLTEGYWGGPQRSFDTSWNNQITANITALTAQGQELARWAFEVWEAVANIEFIETSALADITFDDNQPGAFTNMNFLGQSIQASAVNVSTKWLSTYGGSDRDQYAALTYIHELGHALGLGHQGQYNHDAHYGQDETFANDSWQLSVMSYFNQSENTTINASRAIPLTAMMSDIVAIQNLYGAPGNNTATAGNTAWGNTGTTSGYQGVLNQALSGQPIDTATGAPVAVIIYDRDGIDTLDLATSTTANRIDMRDTQYSDINGLIGNMGIARGTIIENMVAGSGDDTITGNAAANRISGNGGADSISGGGGDDTLTGGAGCDTLEGGAGNDILRGGFDFDLLVGNQGDDKLFGGRGRDTLLGGAGNDALYDDGQEGDLGRDLFFGEQGNDTLYANGGRDTLHGQNGNDSLYGGYNNDLIYGGNQFDQLFGQVGNDTLVGGNGRDTMRGGNGNDILRDNGQRGDLGRDLLFGDDGNDRLFANGGNDTLYGGDGDDRLFGGFDNDLLYGGNQSDRLAGQDGDDTLFGGSGRDTLLGGQGNDRLVDNGERGDPGGDVFNGENGNDTLRIGAGNDTVTGGADADSFEFFGTNIGTDVVTDFGTGADRLGLDDALWNSTLSRWQVVDQFADDSSGVVIFDFGGGNTITLTGVTSTAGLAGDVFIF